MYVIMFYYVWQYFDYIWFIFAYGYIMFDNLYCIWQCFYTVDKLYYILYNCYYVSQCFYYIFSIMSLFCFIMFVLCFIYFNIYDCRTWYFDTEKGTKTLYIENWNRFVNPYININVLRTCMFLIICFFTSRQIFLNSNII